MMWAYVLENQGKYDFRSNQPVFKLIRKNKIKENNVIVEEEPTYTEWEKLLPLLQPEDTLIIRSVEDVADSLSNLISVFQKLADKRVILCSCEEQFLNGIGYLDALSGYIKLYVSFEKKKQQKLPVRPKMVQPDFNNPHELTALIGMKKSAFIRYDKE